MIKDNVKGLIRTSYIYIYIILGWKLNSAGACIIVNLISGCYIIMVMPFMQIKITRAWFAKFVKWENSCLHSTRCSNQDVLDRFSQES